MAVRTGEQFLAGLRDDREVWLAGSGWQTSQATHNWLGWRRRWQASMTSSTVRSFATG